MTEEIRRIPSTEREEDCPESWERLTDDPDIPGVDASMISLGEQPYWSVWEEDREVWGVTGVPSGEALVRAAAGVVDHLAASARAYVGNL